MIPISLTLKGIYSYREEQRIDFTRLTEASIFGIFGAVGSGKSTILEAISFALYGETERLNQRDNRNYNMMNLKSDELLIDFTFRAGENDGEYRFIAKGKRNSKNFEKVGTFERTAYHKQGEDWIPVDVLSIETIIGLSYNNFRRTIIIPQNQFQEFLQLGDKDRTEMMKQIFHLHKFELDDKVRILEAKNLELCTVAVARMAQVGPVTQAEIDLATEQLKNTKALVSEADKVLKEKQWAAQQLKDLKELFERVGIQQNLVAKLEKQEPEIKSLEARIKEYEFCLLNFKNLIDNKRTQQQNIAEQKKELEIQKKMQEDTTKQLALTEVDFNKARTDYERREQIKSRIDELKKLANIKRLEAEEIGLQARVTKGEEALIVVNKKITELTDRQSANLGALTQLRKGSTDLVVLSGIRDWFTIRKGLEQNIEILKEEYAEQRENILKCLDRQRKLITPAIKKITGPVPEDATPTEIFKMIEEVKNALKKEIQALEEQVQHLIAQNKLHEYAIALKDGMPCPVCGATEHPQVLDNAGVGKNLEKVKDLKRKSEEKAEMLDTVAMKLGSIAAETASHGQNLEKTDTKLKAGNDLLAKHDEKYVWNTFAKNDEDAVGKAFARAELERKQIEELERVLSGVGIAIDEQNKLYKKYGEGLTGVKEEQMRKSSAIETIRAQLTISDLADLDGKKEDELDLLVKALEKQFAGVESEYKRLDAIINELKDRKNHLKGGIGALVTGLEAANGLFSKIETELNQKLNGSGFESLEVIEVILKTNLSLDNERKKIHDYHLQLHSAREQLNLLKEQATGKNYDEKFYHELLKEINELQVKSDELVALRESISNNIKTQTEALVTLQKLQVELDELTLRKEDIGTLKQLFKAGGFINFISSVYLHDLCNKANARFFQLTRQKLKLEVSANNNFEVRDFMNNGQLRSVKTLSGGQTFQAALSLALAMADSIQKQSKSSQNFFFLDEGFGSLDRESLQVVFATLQTLRKENRIVGVISHVEEMQQEIDTWLKVVNEEERGSVIETSWSKN